MVGPGRNRTASPKDRFYRPAPGPPSIRTRIASRDLDPLALQYCNTAERDPRRGRGLGCVLLGRLAAGQTKREGTASKPIVEMPRFYAAVKARFSRAAAARRPAMSSNSPRTILADCSDASYTSRVMRNPSA